MATEKYYEMVDVLKHLEKQHGSNNAVDISTALDKIRSIKIVREYEGGPGWTFKMDKYLGHEFEVANSNFNPSRSGSENQSKLRMTVRYPSETSSYMFGEHSIQVSYSALKAASIIMPTMKLSEALKDPNFELTPDNFNDYEYDIKDCDRISEKLQACVNAIEGSKKTFNEQVKKLKAVHAESQVVYTTPSDIKDYIGNSKLKFYETQAGVVLGEVVPVAVTFDGRRIVATNGKRYTKLVVKGL